MPFQEKTRMQERQKMTYQVLYQGVSISQAAREAGVSRVTAHAWVERARRDGVAGMQEYSRRPHHSPSVTPVLQVAREQVLQLKAKRPAWGAKKLHASLWPPDLGAAPVCVRSVDRWLKQEGLVMPRAVVARPQRFERAQCNQLWQLDFKGLEAHWGYRPLSLLDDCSRFCLRLEPVVGRSTCDYWPILWQAFGEYGLPECILCDNGDGFNNTVSLGPTPFQAWLWRLGVMTMHGRSCHPQTQGKVERFHRMLEAEWKQELRQREVGEARRLWPGIVSDYNWVRPHEALGGRVPGAVYELSLRKRPARLPEAVIAHGAVARKVDEMGRIRYKGRAYRAGRGLAGQWVELREDEGGLVIFYANHRIAPLQDVPEWTPTKV
jgi:transposase InsO family protein